MFEFSNYSAEAKSEDDSNKLEFGKLKDETGGAAVEGFVELKLNIYFFCAR